MGRSPLRAEARDRSLQGRRSAIDIQRTRVDGHQVEGDPGEQHRGDDAEKAAAWHGVLDPDRVMLLPEPGTRARSIAPRFPLAPP
jgi:hypothetical protein